MLYANVLVLALVAFAPSALAQASAYGQCGGQGWSGATTCVSGWACTYSNQYYSQCLPATSTSTSTSTTTTSSKSTSTSTTSTKTSTSSSSSPTSTSGPNYWFSFGDSYTQTGFSINGTQPTLATPLGNPAYPGYTATGGPNWIDVAATQYNHSALLTYNFAVGGSTIVWDIVGNSYGSTLESQVGNFTYWDTAAKRSWTSLDALFSFWFGINDIGNSYYLSSNQSAFDGDLIYAYFNQVQRLYNLGARNFLFLNVPPIDRSPLMQAQGASATAAEAVVIGDFNKKLAAAASAWGANHTGARTWVYDAHTAFSTILDDPTKYGFVDNTSYGGTGDFWGNNYHPASAASVMFGEQVGSLLASTVW